MSPKGTKRLGDVHELPACAPAGLKALCHAAEAVIQEQVRMLGSGTPSKAPDLQKLLSRNGISDAKDESTMVDKYKTHKTKIHDATSGIDRQDKGIAVKTAGIGDAVTKAYSAVDSSVGDLNTKIDASFKTVKTVVTQNDDGQKSTKQELPAKIVDGLFNAVWETLTTTYTSVHDVTDQVAKQALEIRKNPPGSPPSADPTAGGGIPSFPTGGASPAAYSGGGGVSPAAYSGGGSNGTAIIPTADKPTAMKMMEYLIEEHHFTPAQAAGIVANAKFESGFEVSAVGDSGSAQGLFQWRFNRLTGLRDFAKGQDGTVDEDGKPRGIGNWRTHIDYMVKELRGGSYQAADSAVTVNAASNTSVEQTKVAARNVASGFDHSYEKSAGASTDARRDYAAGLIDEYNAAQKAKAPTSMAV
ncbi:hypothetical protein NONO_c20200 [Nocardia nova SH22a]|uniref:Phage tail lysozyme domain-containing protein n=1 Tax=Nocardia nova SH22a TaxID=1415166 RepID=W5TBU1_9NOCA|nr:hypothetical protein NONO_c20200 [Nocardia nova SH22a]